MLEIYKNVEDVTSWDLCQCFCFCGCYCVEPLVPTVGLGPINMEITRKSGKGDARE